MADFDHLANVMGHMQGHPRSPKKKQKGSKSVPSENQGLGGYTNLDGSHNEYADPQDDLVIENLGQPNVTSWRAEPRSMTPSMGKKTTQGKKSPKKKKKKEKKKSKKAEARASKAEVKAEAKARAKAAKEPSKLEADATDNEYNGFEGFDAVDGANVKEVPRTRLTVENELGQGAFGVVVKGRLMGDDGVSVACACKTLKDVKNKTGLDELVAEAKLMWSLNHENVIKCFGQITSGKPVMILLEFMSNGSLHSYLEQLPDMPPLQRLMKMAIDTARGMGHLEASGNIHRDLATRNVLVNEELTCKIADFGLSRALDDETYYQSEGGMVAIRWAAPEAYKFKKYSMASDVWSYGITLYEMWTKAAVPYGKKWTNMNVMLKVEEGYRLPPPKGCPKAVYALMVQCWNPRRKLRPTFSSIKDRLEMAHDMLFPDDDAGDDDGYLAVNGVEAEDYGGLESMYLGLTVPTEDDVDNTEQYEYVVLLNSVSAPTTPSAPPVQQRNPKSAMLRNTSTNSVLQGALAREAAMALKNSSTKSPKPDRFSNERFKVSGLPSPITGFKRSIGTIPTAPKLPTTKPTTPLQRKLSPTKKNRGGGDDGGNKTQFDSLRRQKSAIEQVNAPSTDRRTSSVADVLAQSKLREHQAQSEEFGLYNANKAGADVKPNEYIESVGRALEASPMKGRGGRTKCTCRRAVCICGARK